MAPCPPWRQCPWRQCVPRAWPALTCMLCPVGAGDAEEGKVTWSKQHCCATCAQVFHCGHVVEYVRTEVGPWMCGERSGSASLTHWASNAAGAGDPFLALRKQVWIAWCVCGGGGGTTVDFG